MTVGSKYAKGIIKLVISAHILDSIEKYFLQSVCFVF